MSFQNPGAQRTDVGGGVLQDLEPGYRGSRELLQLPRRAGFARATPVAWTPPLSLAQFFSSFQS